MTLAFFVLLCASAGLTIATAWGWILVIMHLAGRRPRWLREMHDECDRRFNYDGKLMRGALCHVVGADHV